MVVHIAMLSQVAMVLSLLWWKEVFNVSRAWTLANCLYIGYHHSMDMGAGASPNNTAAITAGIMVPALVIVIVVIIVIVNVWFILQRKSKRTTHYVYLKWVAMHNTVWYAIGVLGYRGFKEMSIVDKIKLELVTDRKFRKCTIQSSCNLKDALDYQLKASFKRGHVYYEFTHSIENISMDKELIFMKKVIMKAQNSCCIIYLVQ